MSPPRAALTTTEIYDQALKYCRDFRLPPGAPQPGYTATWLEENIAVLERYREWLSGGGTSPLVIRTYHIPMAGHALSLNHKPSRELDLEKDLQAAMEYTLAKGHGADWTENCRLSLLKFRRFLLHERGRVECKVTPYAPVPHTQGLPDWVVEALTRLQHIRQRNWRAARVEVSIRSFWSGHLRVWRFLVEQCGVRELSEVRRKMLYDYAEHRLSLGKSVSGTNSDLRDFVDNTLVWTIQTGKFQELYDKWMGPKGVVPIPMSKAYQDYLQLINYPLKKDWWKKPAPSK